MENLLEVEEVVVLVPEFSVGDMVKPSDSISGIPWEVIGIDNTHYHLRYTIRDHFLGTLSEKFANINAINEIYELV
tara:strand:+ start:7968 stop:8195 length:228 start_codon:yes stop_codon:yes gene_type:complete